MYSNPLREGTWYACGLIRRLLKKLIPEDKLFIIYGQIMVSSLLALKYCAVLLCTKTISLLCSAEAHNFCSSLPWLVITEILENCNRHVKTGMNGIVWEWRYQKEQQQQKGCKNGMCWSHLDEQVFKILTCVYVQVVRRQRTWANEQILMTLGGRTRWTDWLLTVPKGYKKAYQKPAHGCQLKKSPK